MEGIERLKPSLNINHSKRKKFMLTDEEREKVYSDTFSIKATKYTGKITENIKQMLELFNKLAKLGKIVKQKGISLDSFIQPYRDDKQDFRCYLSGNYVTAEIRATIANREKDWIEVISDHNADGRSGRSFLMSSGFENDEIMGKVNEAIEAVIETIEAEIHNAMNDEKIIFEQIKRFGIVQEDKKAKERRDMERVQQFGKFMRGEPQEKVKGFEEGENKPVKGRLARWFGFDSKITFS